MKSISIVVAITTSTVFSSCIARKASMGGSGGGATTKSVTINQPDLKSRFISTYSDADKKNILDSLVYSLSITAVQKDSKDDCSSGVTATKFDSGVNAMDKSKFDTVKVTRGCNYIVSMKIGQKTDDGKSIKTLLISTWDDNQPSILTREDLEKATPVAAPILFVTAEGKKYWDVDQMTTSSDSDGFVRLTADNMTAETIPGSVSGFNQVLMKGTVDITPVTAPKADLYCGLALRAVMHNDAAVDQYANLYTEDVQSTGSVVKIPAGSTAKISLKMVGSYIFSPGNNSVTTKSVAYYCTNNADVAKEKIKNCLIGNDPKLPLIAGECQVL